MQAFVRFLTKFLQHSTLVDAIEKEGLAALLQLGRDEFDRLESRLAAVEDHLGITPPPALPVPAEPAPAPAAAEQQAPIPA